MSNDQTGLERRIGLMALILYGVGDILGAGVYGLVGKAAGQMGNAIWIAFVASMIAAGLTGLSYASLSSRYPRAGGASFIIERAFGRPWLAYIVGLAVLASGLTSMATATRVFAGYFTGLITVVPFTAAVFGFGLLLAFIVYWGIRESIWVNSLCTVIELGGLVLIILFGSHLIGRVDYFDATSAVNASGDLSFSLILSGAVLTFYSFVGFEDMLNVSEEVKSPERNLPIGLLGAIGISSLVYILISLIAVSALPAAELAQSNEPLVDVARQVAPWFPSAIYSLVAMFAVSNTALLNFIMGSRLVYGMAQQGLLPKTLGRVHTKRRTPHIAVGVLLMILLALALSGDISSLAKATSVLLLLGFMLINASLIVLKSRAGEPPGRFEIPRVVPLLGSLICAALLSFAKMPELLTAGAIIAVIALLYFVLRPSKEAIENLEH